MTCKTSLFTLAVVLGLYVTPTQLAWGQANSKSTRQTSEPILSDSASTLLVPTTYDAALFTSDKKLTWGNYYANIIVYNFKTDTYKKLFAKDTFIEGFNDEGNFRYTNRLKTGLKNFSKHWIFYIVRSTDFDGNGKIDDHDPGILFVTDRRGEGLKSISPEHENIVSIEIYEKQGFALVKVQRDANKDGDFKYEDKDFYLAKIDLSTLSWGNKIEIR